MVDKKKKSNSLAQGFKSEPMQRPLAVPTNMGFKSSANGNSKLPELKVPPEVLGRRGRGK
ncbi:MAG: hypothetical protein [Caudoviricetes sp.]|nr:MAG: hypothetical protein [Caudoviricetes sp.]